MERLITAYQDGLRTLEQLREKMPTLKQQSQAVNSELQSLEMAKLDQAKYLKLAHNLSGFRNNLRARAQTLDVKERQQILRSLVKEVLVDLDTLTSAIRFRNAVPNQPSLTRLRSDRRVMFPLTKDSVIRPKYEHGKHVRDMDRVERLSVPEHGADPGAHKADAAIQNLVNLVAV